MIISLSFSLNIMNMEDISKIARPIENTGQYCIEYLCQPFFLFEYSTLTLKKRGQPYSNAHNPRSAAHLLSHRMFDWPTTSSRWTRREHIIFCEQFSMWGEKKCLEAVQPTAAVPLIPRVLSHLEGALPTSLLTRMRPYIFERYHLLLQTVCFPMGGNGRTTK